MVPIGPTGPIAPVAPAIPVGPSIGVDAESEWSVSDVCMGMM
jgi:hypothetical protein